MPRQNRRRDDPRDARPAPTTLGERTEDWRGVTYRVRTVAGAAQTKVYRCPGCDQEIRGGNHLVVWPDHDLDAEDRRHWHAACWGARGRRAPGTVRSRNAPRY